MTEQAGAPRFVPPSVECVRTSDGGCRIVVAGDIDDGFGDDIVRTASYAATHQPTSSIVLDLKAVAVFGAAGLRLLQNLEELAAGTNTGLSVSGASNTTRRVMTMYAFDRLVEQPPQ